MNLENIKKHLISKIKVEYIKIYDNSAYHNRSEKDLTHLKIIIISDDFINQKLIDRHRFVFLKLSEIIKEKIYSTTLYTYTTIEWKNKKQKIKNDLKCFKKKCF